ncbi:hypothetical protein BH23BAC4_BH23BAC4_09300 [soil metagenome]
MTSLSQISLSAAAVVAVAIAIKGFILLGGTFAVTRFMRNAAADTRHQMWTATFAALILLPVLHLVLPMWSVPVLPSGAEVPAVEMAQDLGSITDAAPLLVAESAPAGIEVGQGLLADGPALPANPMLSIGPAAGNLVLALRSAIEGASSLFLLWLGGSLLVGLGWIIAALAASRLIDSGEPLLDAKWQTLLERLTAEMEIDRPVRLIKSNRIAVPAVWGNLEPVVVLPVDATAWPAIRREAVLAHELAHLARRDAFTQWIAQCAVALHWFNPLAWMAYRRSMLEREHACDDWVLRLGTAPTDYADSLIAIARTIKREGMGRERLVLEAVAPMARASHLEGRIISILDTNRKRMGAGLRGLLTAAALCTIVLLPLAAFHPVARDTGKVATLTDPVSSSGFFTGTDASVADESTESRNQDFVWDGRVAAGATIIVHGANSNVIARRTTGDRIQVRAVTVRGRSARGDVRYVARPSRDGVALCAIFPGQDESCTLRSGPHGRAEANGLSVNWEIDVPANTHFATNVGNGNVQASGLDSDLTLRTSNGNVRADTRRTASVTTSNGNIELRAADIGTVQSSNGRISATIERGQWSGDASVRTTNGSITVVLPPSVNADIVLRTSNGRATSDFDLGQTRGRRAVTRLGGRLGNGGRTLNLQSTNGAVDLRNASRRSEVTPSERNSITSAHVATDHVRSDGARLGMEVSGIIQEVLAGLGSLDALSATDRLQITRETERTLSTVEREMSTTLSELTYLERASVQEALEAASREVQSARREVRRVHGEPRQIQREAIREAQIETERALQEAHKDIERAREDARTLQDDHRREIRRRVEADGPGDDPGWQSAAPNCAPVLGDLT